MTANYIQETVVFEQLYLKQVQQCNSGITGRGMYLKYKIITTKG
mgnify:CR=1 FL=1